MSEKGFEFVNQNLINIYNDVDNKPLDIEDECYFLFSNINDTHLLLIGKGIVIDDQIIHGVHKQYKIELTGIIEAVSTQTKFIYGRQFKLVNNSDGKFSNEKITYIQGNSTIEFFKKNLFKIDCFFVRNTLDAIKLLRSEYDKIVLKDLRNQIYELENERI